MSTLFAALSLLCAAAPPAPASTRAQAHPKRFSASVDRLKSTLGDPFTLTIEVVHAPQDTYSLPQPLIAGELTVRSAPQVTRRAEGNDAITTFVIPLVNLKTLHPKIPDLPLLVDGPEGSRLFTVPGQALQFESVVEPQEGKQQKLKGPMAPKPMIPIRVRSYLWVAVLAGLIAFGGLLWGAAVLGRRAREERERRNRPPPLGADEEALRRIAALRDRAPWNDGAGRAAIFELSEIVRTYLGRRLGFDAIDLTADELIDALKRRRILGLDLAELTDELAWESLVKFARLEPTVEECEEALVRAANLVERTRPIAAAQKPAPAEARA